MTADLSALIARLEAAEVVTHTLEVELAAFMYANQAAFKGVVNYDPELWVERNQSPLCSLDAALALAERVLPGRRVAIVAGHNPAAVVAERPGESWHIGDDLDDSWSTKASTPALALCIAILRAKQGEG